jgi:hypothetical protein
MAEGGLSRALAHCAEIKGHWLAVLGAVVHSQEDLQFGQVCATQGQNTDVSETARDLGRKEVVLDCGASGLQGRF